MTSNELPRHYHEWTDQDYRIIATGLSAGMSDAEVAKGAGRTLSAVQSRARYLAGRAQSRGGAGAAWKRLREIFGSDPGYDWESVARSAHESRSLPYWDQDSEDRLAQVWGESRRPARSWLRRGSRPAAVSMAQLEAELGIHEYEIAKRLRYLGLAESFAEIVDRFGASPEGALAARARLQRERESVILHVLNVTDESGAVLHTSLHPSRKAADQAKDSLASRFAGTPLACWTITARAVGDGAIGAEPVAGTFGTPETVPGLPDLDAFYEQGPAGEPGTGPALPPVPEGFRQEPQDL
ncbi:hypothetical protein AB0H60_34165 [Nocardia rhamnosiphila]|uniref:hypothetical protein n=1 Tax=Nocardia rhamnosiphila TaxID=426716 RepID=UPI0033CCF944